MPTRGAGLVLSPYSCPFPCPVLPSCSARRSHRGAYKGSEVPRDHESLRTIPMYGNMLTDHGSQA